MREVYSERELKRNTDGKGNLESLFTRNIVGAKDSNQRSDINQSIINVR